MRKKTQTVKWRLCGAVVLIPAEKEARRSNAKGDKKVKMPSVKLKEELIEFEWKKRGRERLKEKKNQVQRLIRRIQGILKPRDDDVPNLQRSRPPDPRDNAPLRGSNQSLRLAW